jgi:hypothetical protein
MVRHAKAFAIFPLFCLLIGLGARSGSRAHVFDLAWIGFVWTIIIAISVGILFKARGRWREPGGLARLGESRGLWLLPRGVKRWLFDEHQHDGNAEPGPRG